MISTPGRFSTSPSAYAAHGRLDAEAAKATAGQAMAEVVLPCVRALLEMAEA
jgi:hypothetical protein